MLTTNANYINAASAAVREPRLKLYFGDNVFYPDLFPEGIYSVEKDSINFSGQCIGNAIPQTLKITTNFILGDLSENVPLNVEYLFGDLTAGLVNPTFYVKDLAVDAATTQVIITAKDALDSLIDEKFEAKTNGEETAEEFFARFCDAFHFVAGEIKSPFKTVLMPKEPNFADDDNALTVLSKFAEFMCCNAYIKNKNELCLSSPFITSGTEDDIPVNVPFGVSKITATSAMSGQLIARVVLSRGDLNDNKYYPKEDIGETADDVTEFVITNNPFFDNNDSLDSRELYIEALYNHLNGKYFTGYDLSYMGNPVFECGDILTAHSGLMGTSFHVPYLGERLIFKNGLRGEISINYNRQSQSYRSPTVRESLKEAGIKVDKANAEIQMVASQSNTDIEVLRGLLDEAKTNSDNLKNNLETQLKGIEGKFVEFTEDVDGLHASITSITNSIEDGLPTLKNTTVDIDLNGVTVGELGEEVVTNINASGLYINNVAGGQVAEFNKEGARIKNVVTKNLNAAGTLFQRFQQNGEWWVGAFWIGEDELWD